MRESFVNKKMNGILFDLDGTLWDSSDYVVESWNQVLAKYGRKQITVRDMRHYMGRTMEAIAKMMMPDESDEMREKIFKECCDNEVMFLRQHGGILFNHLEETLLKLQKRYRLFVVSNCQIGYIEAFLQYHQLEKYFDDTENYGRTGLEKGENIKLVVERNHLDKAVYVGDVQGDLDSADMAGIPFIQAAYGFGTVNRKVPKINDITELPDCVEKLFGE